MAGTGISELSVAPKEKITLDFAIDVPPDAEPGTHWGTLLVTTDPKAIEKGIAMRTTIGLIILVRVPGATRNELALESFSVTRPADTPPVTLAARFKNMGTVHEVPVGAFEVKNILGSIVATGTLPLQNVLPGTVRRVEAEAGSGAWFGRYTATLHATYAGGTELPVTSVTFWMVPWKTYGPWVLGAILVLSVLSFEPKRLLLALRILITGRATGKPEDTTGAKDQRNQ